MLSFAPDRWETITDLLGEALEHGEEERAAFLDAACAGDPDLRWAVERLLAAHARAEATGRFERGALTLLGDALPEPAAPPEVGPYRLLREVGRGGMGTVWLAERADGLYRQQVAVKLMRAGLLAEGQRQRFRAERRILARLDHPGIARILDGGVAEGGQPYLVMEYVEGEPITDYCATGRGLGLEARLALFRQACEAVAYAHRNLVVHRDLKPSNLFVTGGGRPGGEAARLRDREAPRHRCRRRRRGRRSGPAHVYSDGRWPR
jgi:eukaryotic-like serine/threonine-protein kinase